MGGTTDGARQVTRRGGVLVALVALVAVPLVACGDDEEAGAFETLPPIRTTTTSSTTSTTLAPQERIFYTLKRGDTLGKVASAFDVTVGSIVELNRDVITDPNNVPAGVTIEIPTGIVVIDELPDPTQSTEA